MSLRIAVIGDLHYPNFEQNHHTSARDEFYSRVLRSFLSYNADFHIAVGDVTHDGHTDQWTQLLHLVSQHHSDKARQTFRLILGNHDTLLAAKAKVQELTGQPRYFVEETPDCRLIFLDTTKESSPKDWGGLVDGEQLEWLKSLQQLPPKTTLVFGHHPFPETTTGSDEPMMNISNDEEVFAVLRALSPAGVYLNGHNHAHSIIEQHEQFPGWSFVQSASVLSSQSFRVIEVSPTHVHVSTIHVSDPELAELSATTRSGMTDYMHHPSAMGSAGDQHALLPRVK